MAFRNFLRGVARKKVFSIGPQTTNGQHAPGGLVPAQQVDVDPEGQRGEEEEDGA